ncbi:MAG: TIGR02186 family protein [Thermodesulfovibrionales bacterium]
MNREKRTAILLLVIALTVLGMAVMVDRASAELTAIANHDHITIDFFYHGSTVSVRGVADPDADLIIKIASPEGHETLKEKGKVGGFLWMNVATLTLENVPNLYSIHSTKKIEEILDQQDMDKYVIGYPALGRHVEMSPIRNDEDKARWFSEFIKYKENSKLYATSAGKIELKKDESGKQPYYILTEWPYQAPPGDYLVTVYAVKNGKVIEQAESKVLVEQVGIIKTLSNMAKKNGALYGFISIISALGAGFGVGLVFRKGGGAH